MVIIYERGENMNLSYNPEGLRPYFQVDDSKRIRFLIESLSILELKDIISRSFKNHSTVQCKVLIGYRYKRIRRKEKTNIGKFFTINNWYEEQLIGEDGTAYTFANINIIDNNELIRYCISLKNGCRSAYILFYNEQITLYVNNDVFDIVSSDEKFINHIKRNYINKYDRLHEK